MSKTVPIPFTESVQGLREFPYINTSERTAKHSDVFLDRSIEEPSEYRELLSILFNAGEYDTIHIFINSSGGNLDTALAIIEGIQHTSASVTAFLIGSCHSAASMIALSCNQVVISDSANMLVHSASFGTGGTTSNVKSHTDFVVKQTNKLLDKIYEDFLTKEEMLNIKLGVEIWMNAKNIRKRFKMRAKLMKAKQAENVKKV